MKESTKESTLVWAPISDLPDDVSPLANDELPGLASVWHEQAASLKESEATTEFNMRLCREWAIETGILEKLYDLDQGITQVLIEQGLDSSLIPHGATDQDADHVMDLIRDQHDAIEGLFDFVASKRDLSTSYICELHQNITRHQSTTTALDQFDNRIEVALIRGQWKLQPNNPTRSDGALHAYCPPEHVQSEMDNLIAWSNGHRETDVPPEIAAAWLHHRFTQIHPFQDGNGRIARALASLIFLRSGWFPLVIRRNDRDRYIRALEIADMGDLKPLSDLFAEVEKRAFVNALGLSRAVLHESAGIADIIEAAKDVIAGRAREEAAALQRVFPYSKILEDIVKTRLQEIRKTLLDTFGELDGNLEVFVTAIDDKDNRSHYFHSQIIEVAKGFNYFANTLMYRAWLRLCIQYEKSEMNVLLSFHGLGHDFNGILVCSGQTFGRDEESNKFQESLPLGDGPFQFNFRDHEAALKARFDRWLDEVLKHGLDRWRRSL